MSKEDEIVNNIKHGVEEVIKGEDVLYDDFFTDEDDPGVDVIIEHRGKKLPFRLKRSVTLAEKQAANDASIVIALDDKGVPTLKKMDQSAFTREIVLAGVKEWPFKYSDHKKIAPELRGKGVPINRKTVGRMDGTLADKIAAVLLGQQEAQLAALGPFGRKLEEVSTQEAPRDLS